MTERVRIEQAIAAYVVAHPNASDTIDGVRLWWLAGRCAATELLEAALDDLVRRRVLARRILPDGRVIYSAGDVPYAHDKAREDD